VESFREQKRAGGLNVLWQVIAHHETMSRLLDEERQTFPQTTTDYERELHATLPRINARKDQQYADADLIVTNSEFARQTFIDAGIAGSKVHAIRTGCPPVIDRAVEHSPSRPMIFLSAGSQSLRKGVPYLLEAWKKLRPVNAELWLVGQMQLPSELLKDLPAGVIVKPPVSREELERVFRHSSVLVLPTLAEGLAHIVLEALSAGLAVITTENSGCGDLVEDGVNGWKIPTRDSDAIAERIEWCVQNPDAVIAMQQGSQVKAAKWQENDFAEEHARLISSFLVKRGVQV
jgi:glycosyltransferase involved in cell wall biosynthesis